MPHNVSALPFVLTGDPALLAVVRLGVPVALPVVVLRAPIGAPAGAAVAVPRCAGVEAVAVIINALMGLPPVVVGLLVYLLLSRTGPLGAWGPLLTAQAMVIAHA